MVDLTQVEGRRIDGEQGSVAGVEGNQRSVGEGAVDEQGGQTEGRVGHLTQVKGLASREGSALGEVKGGDEGHLDSQAREGTRELDDADLAARDGGQHGVGRELEYA